MEYEVLVGSSAESLAAIVEVHIALGYKPIGGVGVAMNDYGKETFSQVVIK